MFVPGAKVHERGRARELRAEGQSLRRIAQELGVALSSVSVWVRDVERPVAEAAPRALLRLPVLRPTAFRTCGSCRTLLPITRFNRNKGGYQHWCRECYAAYFKARGQLHRDQVQRAKAKRRVEARKLVTSHLTSHPCQDCGESDPRVLEFDHVGIKAREISLMVVDGASCRAIRREIAQCEVVCVNCHRKRTYERLGSWRVNPSVLDAHPRVLDGRARNMLFVRDLLLESECVDCNTRELSVLEFDHVRGKKLANITALTRMGHSLSRLQAEISKCEVRCANCHRRRTRATPAQLSLDAA